MPDEKPLVAKGMQRLVWVLLCLILLAAAAVCVLAITRLSGAQQRIQTLEQQVAQLEASQAATSAAGAAVSASGRVTVATDAPPKAIGPYSQGVMSGGLLFTAGQIGLDPATGTLADGVENQARQAMDNIGAILQAQGLGYGNIVKTTLYLTDMADFSAVNTLYATYFSADYPARSTVQVAALPKGALVEIECVATR